MWRYTQPLSDRQIRVLRTYAARNVFALKGDGNQFGSWSPRLDNKRLVYSLERMFLIDSIGDMVGERKYAITELGMLIA